MGPWVLAESEEGLDSCAGGEESGWEDLLESDFVEVGAVADRPSAFGFNVAVLLMDGLRRDD